MGNNTINAVLVTDILQEVNNVMITWNLTYSIQQII
jgi:hypothetical protein